MIWIEKAWYKKHFSFYLLLPFVPLFWLLSSLRRLCFKLGLKKADKPNIPVLVVGNITVGGTGKTPMVLTLIELAQKQGFVPGVISRGYKAQCQHFPHLIKDTDTANFVGDEPKLIAVRANVPVVIGADRVASAQLLADIGCNLVICDDGLQHYRLARDLELILLDGNRLLGNGCLLPAGPLREGKWRLKTTEFVIYNHLASQPLHFNVIPDEPRPLSKNTASVDISKVHWQVISGIGNPERFYQSIKELGLTIESKKSFIDHHQFTEQDFTAYRGKTVLMTEKDAVKCRDYDHGNLWYLPISAKLSPELMVKLTDQLEELKQRYGL
ncbi:tetraacyldisaccharide 4'-kinase [Catenovulum sp. SM1970]|uniref:tetraacyldisaccharide 4'-kinase n=1 Tax=Marinifaba aquimaris TaxID=2741323 RepID=UPI001574CD10|nr:tetraacyldisaccharide 4'-kinase [Marinifaba aquimaris]NTS77715.1 tetraacyldisaccharide 4'-kinase [Marinifaba aquimaris]